jgi:hypothetical protein
MSDEQLRSICTELLNLKIPKGRKRDDLIGDISAELRSAAGNSILNLSRSEHEFPWKQIVIDVADKLTPGYTPLSWTSHTLGDRTPVEKIEIKVLKLFEKRARKWWKGLSRKQKEDVTQQMNAQMRRFKSEEIEQVLRSTRRNEFWTTRGVDWIFSKGVIFGLEALPASGLFGLVGGSLLSSIGWYVVTNTVGYMFGFKLLITGVLAGHAFRSFSIVGGAAAGVVTTIPVLVWSFTETNYRKTIPVTLLLLSNAHLKNKLSVHAPSVAKGARTNGRACERSPRKKLKGG